MKLRFYRDGQPVEVSILAVSKDPKSFTREAGGPCEALYFEGIVELIPGAVTVRKRSGEVNHRIKLARKTYERIRPGKSMPI